MQTEKFDSSSQPGKQDNKNPVAQPPRQKQRITAIALSAITCIFLCVIGFEIINNKPPSWPGLKKDTASLFFSKKSLHNKVTLGKPLAPPENSSATAPAQPQNDAQIEQLVQLNQLQAQKIKKLREELADINQRLNDVRPESLATAEPVIEENANIENVPEQDTEKFSKQIAEQEELNQKLTATLQENEQKTHHLQLAIDALTTMVHTHKDAHEKTKEQLQIHLAEAQERHKGAKEHELELLATIAKTEGELNDAIARAENDKLRIQELEHKLAINTNLLHITQSELEPYKVRVEQAEQALQIAVNDLQDSKDSQKTEFKETINLLNEQIVTLRMDLNAETDRSASVIASLKEENSDLISELTSKSETLSKQEEKFNLMRGVLIELKDRLSAADKVLVRQNETIEAKQSEINQLSATMETTKTDLLAQLDVLTNELHQEKTRGEELKQQLAEGLQQEKAHSEEIAKKLNDELQQEKSKSDDLAQKLTFARNEYDAEQRRAQDILQQLMEIELQKLSTEQQLSQHQKMLANREQQVDDLSNTLEATKTNLASQYDTLQNQLNQEKAKSDSLAQKLTHAKEEYEQEQRHAQEIAQQLNQIAEKSSSAEQKLTQHQNTLTSREQQINALAQALEATRVEMTSQIESIKNELSHEKTNSQALAQKLAQVQKEYETEQRQAQEVTQLLKQLEQQSTSTQQQLHHHQNALASKEQQIDALSKDLETTRINLAAQLEESKRLLQQEKARGEALTQQLTQSQEQYDAEKQRSQEVAQQLKQFEKKSTTAEQKLALHQHTLSTREAQVNDLTSSLESTKSELTAQIESLHQELIRERAKSQSLQEELTVVKDDYDAEQHSTYELDRRLKAITQELKVKEKNLADAEQTLSDIVQRMDDLERENYKHTTSTK